jgi:hypothetical protein
MLRLVVVGSDGSNRSCWRWQTSGTAGLHNEIG